MAFLYGVTRGMAIIGMNGMEIRVDARGLRCPLPALRLARAVRENGPGIYLVLTDDPAAQVEIPALARERNWQAEPLDGGFRVEA